MQTVWTSDMLWELFESTGSIWVYLIYRRFAAFRKSQLKFSLN
ncbi:MAG TPA: YqzL family protein [bacterium]|nr:YqzL family protein [bacterium]